MNKLSLQEWMDENNIEFDQLIVDMMAILRNGQSQWGTNEYGKWERTGFELTIKLLELARDNFCGIVDTKKSFEAKLQNVKQLRVKIEAGPEYSWDTREADG